MKTKITYTVGAFAITMILVLAVWGFALVDLSTDEYMPGQFGVLFTLTSLDFDGLRFSFLGENYILPAAPAQQAIETAGRYRGLIPNRLKLAALAAVQGREALEGLWAEDELPAWITE